MAKLIVRILVSTILNYAISKGEISFVKSVTAIIDTILRIVNAIVMCADILEKITDKTENLMLDLSEKPF